MGNEKMMNSRIQHKIDTSENWSKAVNFIPKEGELIIYSDLNKIKIGDGSTNVNDLPFSKSEVNWNEVTNAPIIVQKGSQTGSLVVGEGEAAGKYSVAGGTTDKSMATDLLGSLAGSLVNLEPANAQATGSLAFGANTDSVAAGSISIGVENVAGCLGYYIWDIDFNNKKITLSMSQNSTKLSSKKKPTNLTWSNGDVISIFYNTGYYCCSTITAIDKTNGTITVDSLPITSFKTPTLLEPLTLLPHDNAVYVVEKPVSGEVQLGFAAYAKGYGNKALGVMSNAIGYDNTAVDTAAFVTGRENVGSFGSLVGGYQNKVLKETGFAVGRNNTVNVNNGAALGSNNTVTGNTSFAEGYGHTVSGIAAHAEGSSNQALGETSHAEGQSTKAEGYAAHAEGNRTWAKGTGAHAEGYRTTAYGSRAHSEGESTTQFTEDLIANRAEETAALKIAGAWNEAENANKFSMAFGTAAHTEGKDSLAIGAQAHAEGLRTQAIGANSHTEGELTVASVGYAHAEGYKTEASGAAAHAEGGSTKATNETAHAEGQSTTASGKASHAEGRRSVAEGNYSHAEGNYFIGNDKYYPEEVPGKGFQAFFLNNWNPPLKDGDFVIVHDLSSETDSEPLKVKLTIEFYQQDNEYGDTLDTPYYNIDFTPNLEENIIIGYIRKAYLNHSKGQGSHTEGAGNVAKANYSHVEGYANISEHANQHVQGKWNETGDYAHIVGGGTSENNRKNIHTVDWDGNAVYKGTVTAGKIGYNDMDLVTYGQTVGRRSGNGEVFNCYKTVSEANQNWVENRAIGKYSHAEGAGTYAAATCSHAEGWSTKADGNNSHAEGAQTKAIGNSSHAEGNGTIASGKYQHVQGKYNIQDDEDKYAHIVGNGTSVTDRSNAHTLDWNGNAWFAGEVVASNGRLVSENEIADLIPENKEEFYSYDTFELYGSDYSKNYLFDTSLISSHWPKIIINATNSIGWDNRIYMPIEAYSSDHDPNRGTYVFANDNEILTIDSQEGSWKLSNKNNSADNYLDKTNPSGTGKFSMNDGSASGKNAIALGTGSIASGNYSHTEGLNTNSTAKSAHSEGEGTTASGNYGHAEGYLATASGAGSHAEGSRTIASGEVSHAEGQTTIASGKQAHSEGNHTIASGQASHAEGYGTKIKLKDIYGNEPSNSEDINVGDTSITTNATAALSLDVGDYIAIGTSTEKKRVIGISNGGFNEVYSFNLGSEYDDQDGCVYDVYRIQNGIVDSNFSLNYGNNGIKTGYYVEFEGNRGTYYQITYCHEEDPNSEIPIIYIDGSYEPKSETEKVRVYKKEYVKITLESAVTVNEATQAGDVIYKYTAPIAEGRASHAEGEGTVATANNQHVQGKYNIRDTDKKYAHIVGNGTMDNRTNAHTLDWQGNAWFAGKVTAGADPVNNMDLVTLQYLNSVIGDIEAALDRIIAIQEELINNGGSSDVYTCSDCGAHMDDPLYCNECSAMYFICEVCGTRHYNDGTFNFCENCGTSYSACEWCGTRYIDEGGPPPCGCEGGMPEEEGQWFCCPNCGLDFCAEPDGQYVTCPDCSIEWNYNE